MPFKRKYHTLEDVLRNTVRTPTGCLLWNGAIHRTGYAACSVTGIFTSQALHREVHRLATGERPAMVLHTCDNPRCINPEHLRSGDARSNKEDCVSKGRHAHGSRNGNAKLDEIQVEQMRAQRASGLPYAALALNFKVSKATVWRVISKQNWRS